MRKRVLWVGGIGVAASLLTACTVSISGGIAGIVGTLALLSLLLGIGATQSGCSDDSVGACLKVDGFVSPDSKIFDGRHGETSLDLGVCLQPPLEVGPCLKPPPPDGAVDTVGPCLGPPLPDGGVGPCLSPPPPDASMGPCLSRPAPDASAALAPAPVERSTTGEPAGTLDQQRAAAIARLRHRLPSDVVDRLTGKRGERSS